VGFTNRTGSCDDFCDIRLAWVRKRRARRVRRRSKRTESVL